MSRFLHLSCAYARSSARDRHRSPVPSPLRPRRCPLRSRRSNRQSRSEVLDEAAKKPLKSKTVSPEERIDALSRAAVWIAPPPIARADLGADPKQPKEITCTFEITQLGGTAPKFDCRSENGDRLAHQVRPQPRSAVRSGVGEAAARARLRRRQRDACRKGPLLRLPGRAVHDHEDARLRRRAEALREGDGCEGLQGLRVGGGRAQALWPRRSRPRRSKAGRSSSSI